MERMDFDVVIAGGGVAAFSAAIRLKQLNPSIEICVLEKGAEIGSHILSGCVLETRALDELLPNWRSLQAPINVAVTKDEFLWLRKKGSTKLPTPKSLHNAGNYIVSLGAVTRWLADYAEGLGVQIFAGYPAAKIIWEDERVAGVETGAFGVNKDGSHSDNYQESMAIYAKHTLLAEGCRGSLTGKVEERLGLRKNPQTYGLGIKEIWRIRPENHQIGKVTHTMGYPLGGEAYGGGFIYHADDNKLVIGLITG